jgi:hypothetical protein
VLCITYVQYSVESSQRYALNGHTIPWVIPPLPLAPPSPGIVSPPIHQPLLMISETATGKPPAASRSIHYSCNVRVLLHSTLQAWTDGDTIPASLGSPLLVPPSSLVTPIICPAGVGSYSVRAGLIGRLHSWFPSSESFYGAEDGHCPPVSSLLDSITRACQNGDR